MWWILGPAVLSAFGVWLYQRVRQQFGGRLTRAHVMKYEKSRNWVGDRFVNESKTELDIKPKDLPGLLKAQFTDTRIRRPERPLAVRPFDAGRFTSTDEEPKFVWYGHSVLLVQLKGRNLLIDPMLGDSASPIAPFVARRFSENTLDIIDTLPPIDAVLMTHDHYDHLDYDSIKRLKESVDVFFVALGVSRHLECWGVPAHQITEFDWWDEIAFHGITITFTPSRHFSGRGISDRWKSLWGGWVLCTDKHRIYWSGDSGYGSHFTEIGKRYGPFDWAFLECGQYYHLWRQIHMMPEECVQAAMDVRASVSIPVHWGAFRLSLHGWKDPIERFVTAAAKNAVQVCTPEIGEVVTFGTGYPSRQWWKNLG